MQKHIFLSDENATVELGARFAHVTTELASGLTLYLEGTLGAGKTTFCRGVLRALGHSGAVKSPTYTLVEPYALASIKVYHFDLYRLAEAEELEYMGIRDYFDEHSLRLVEWPARGEGVLPEPDLRFRFDVSGSGRTVNIQAHSLVGEGVIDILGGKIHV